MAWGSVSLREGVNIEATPTANQAFYAESQLGRFKGGFAQKIGGWERFYAFATGGVPRALHAWQDLNEDRHLGVGTTTLLGVVTDSNLTNITPQTLVTIEAPNISTTIGSANVIVDDAGVANVTTYDVMEFRTPVSVGGLILSGVYPIDLVLSTTSYRIVAAAEATASVTSGGAVPVFNVTSGSSSVTVTLADHGLSAGDTVVFPIETIVGGISILGTYPVISVSSSSQFVIAGASLASSTTSGAMDGGDVRIRYNIALGPTSSSTGYSVGTYGSGGYSTGSTITAQTGTPVTSLDWSLDNWGSTFLANRRDGAVYEWTPGTGFETAKMIAAAPPYARGILVTAPAQILMAWGATQYHTIGIDSDPLSYAWSDMLDYSFWTPGVVNPATGQFSQAGSARIPTGSEIRAGLQASQQTLLWTDLDLWSINYIGNPTIGTFGQTKIASSCGAIGKGAVGQLGNMVLWMGASNFFSFNGSGVTPLPCSVWDAVFQDIDMDNAWKVRACPNTPFNEMMWEYPSASGGSGENDSYVKLNILTGAWDIGPIGTMPRSAWIDQSVLGMPIGASPEGLIYQHETGYNADGQAINWSFKSGYWMINEGEEVAFVDLVMPDFKYETYDGSNPAVATSSSAPAAIQITLYSVMYPGDAERTYGPYTVTQDTLRRGGVSTRLRGRQMAVKFSGADLGSFVRIGRVRYRWSADGRF